MASGSFSNISKPPLNALSGSGSGFHISISRRSRFHRKAQGLRKFAMKKRWKPAFCEKGEASRYDSDKGISPLTNRFAMICCNLFSFSSNKMQISFVGDRRRRITSDPGPRIGCSNPRQRLAEPHELTARTRTTRRQKQSIGLAACSDDMARIYHRIMEGDDSVSMRRGTKGVDENALRPLIIDNPEQRARDDASEEPRRDARHRAGATIHHPGSNRARYP